MKIPALVLEWLQHEADAERRKADDLPDNGNRIHALAKAAAYEHVIIKLEELS